MLKHNADIVHVGPDRLRIGPWRGDDHIAFITPVGGFPPSADSIERAMRILARRGYASALTSALSAPEQDAFFASGFTVHERLHLLRHTDTRTMPATGFRIRRGLPFDLAAVLELDGLAFEPFWRLDRAGLRDARRATPTSRYRVAEDGVITGYAITGRAGPIGYLQRLAVHPDHQGRGIGAALVGDALEWAYRRGARSVLVNTQVTNVGAVALYERLGFTREPIGLAVLERLLPDGDDR